MESITSYGEHHTPAQTIDVFSSVLGVRGGRQGGVMEDPASIVKMRTYIDNIDKGASGDAIQSAFAKTAMGQLGIAGAQLSGIFLDMGTAAIPAFTKALEGANAVLGVIGHVTHDSPIGAAGAEAALVGAGLAGAGKLAPSVARRLGASASGAAAAGGRLSALGLTAAEFGAYMLAYGAGTSAGEGLRSWAEGVDERVPWLGDLDDWMARDTGIIGHHKPGSPAAPPGGLSGLSLIGRAYADEVNRNTDPTAPATPGSGSTNVQVTIGAINVTGGAPSDSSETTMRRLGDWLSGAIRRGMSTGGATSGIGSSVYVPGGT